MTLRSLLSSRIPAPDYLGGDAYVVMPDPYLSLPLQAEQVDDIVSLPRVHLRQKPMRGLRKCFRALLSVVAHSGDSIEGSSPCRERAIPETEKRFPRIR